MKIIIFILITLQVTISSAVAQKSYYSYWDKTIASKCEDVWEIIDYQMARNLNSKSNTRNLSASKKNLKKRIRKFHPEFYKKLTKLEKEFGGPDKWGVTSKKMVQDDDIQVIGHEIKCDYYVLSKRIKRNGIYINLIDQSVYDQLHYSDKAVLYVSELLKFYLYKNNISKNHQTELQILLSYLLMRKLDPTFIEDMVSMMNQFNDLKIKDRFKDLKIR